MATIGVYHDETYKISGLEKQILHVEVNHALYLIRNNKATSMVRFFFPNGMIYGLAFARTESNEAYFLLKH